MKDYKNTTFTHTQTIHKELNFLYFKSSETVYKEVLNMEKSSTIYDLVKKIHRNSHTPKALATFSLF